MTDNNSETLDQALDAYFKKIIPDGYSHLHGAEVMEIFNKYYHVSDLRQKPLKVFTIPIGTLETGDTIIFKNDTCTIVKKTT